MTKPTRLERILLNIAVILVILFFMLPIYWLVSTAFKFGREAFAIPPVWFFFDFTLKNFSEVWQHSNVLRFLTNSIIISAGATLLSLLLGVPAGYAIARTKSRLLGFSSYFFLVLLMIPPIAMLIPFYLIMRDFKLLGTCLSLTIISSIFLPLSFIAGVYGMNFAHMPELAWPWAYPVVLMSMLLLAGLLLFFMRRKKWF